MQLQEVKERIKMYLHTFNESYKSKDVRRYMCKLCSLNVSQKQDEINTLRDKLLSVALSRDYKFKQLHDKFNGIPAERQYSY